MSGSVVLAGFMGAGKSTAARSLAAARGGRAIDTDRLVEARIGEPIAAFFAREGEAAFRAVEEQVALEALDRADGEVIALGGGTPTSEAVREALRRHTVVHLDVPAKVAWRRAGRGDRPLARDRDAFVALHAARAELYEDIADVELPAADRRGIRDALPAIDLVPEAGGARLLWAHAPGGGHPVWLREGLLQEPPPWPLPDTSRRVVVTDETVAELHGGRLRDLAGVIEFPAGETHKTLVTCEAVWGAMARQGVTRSDHVVALGGGVVGDLAGFVASTYQRGIPVVQVPTTLVAQVDSSLGGKTGVDLPTAKNYVGAYHHPSAVLIDPTLLETLPPAEMAAGYAEVLKTALIAGGPLWEAVRGGGPIDERTIRRCVRTKLAVVAEDERDGGRRQVLNLGHTVGHAIETVSGYARYRHGEAVGLGLLAALRLSGTDALREEVRGLLTNAGLPTTLDRAVDAEDVRTATAGDKKRLGDAPTPFVLVDAPGAVRHGRRVSPADLLAAVAELHG